MFLFILALITTLILHKPAMAHPVSFEGGYSLMTELSNLKNETTVVYSPKWYYGLGVVHENMNLTSDQPESYLTSGQLSWLVKRWNLTDAQGNIYVFGGPGYIHFKDQSSSNVKSGGFYRFGFQADYETRTFYSMFSFKENRLFQSSNSILNTSDTLIFNQIDLRLGFAPYIANYNQLNSWIILNLRSNSEFKKVSVIPTLRFYFNNFLWELAQDLDGNSYLNFMTRF